MAKRELYDFALLGGCITGITVGLLLQKAGYKVAIIEQQNIGIETVGRYYTVLGEKPGLVEISNYCAPAGQQLKTIYDYTRDGLQLISSFVKNYSIDCDMRQISGKVIPPGDILSEGPFYLFNPFKYIVSLAKILGKNGGLLLENTRVLKIENKDKGYVAFTSRGKVAAKNIIYTPRSSRVLTLKQNTFVPYKAYSMMAKLPNQYQESVFKIPGQNLTAHVTAVNEDITIIEVQGADYKIVKGKNDEAQFNILEGFLKKHFSIQNFLLRWSTVYYKSADGNLSIGPLQNSGTYIVAGYNYSDPVIGTIAALYFTSQLAEIKTMSSVL